MVISKGSTLSSAFISDVGIRFHSFIGLITNSFTKFVCTKLITKVEIQSICSTVESYTLNGVITAGCIIFGSWVSKGLEIIDSGSNVFITVDIGWFDGNQDSVSL